MFILERLCSGFTRVGPYWRQLAAAFGMGCKLCLLSDKQKQKSTCYQLHRKYHIIEIGTILALAIQRVLIDLPPQNQHIHRYPSGTKN
jgi:hypothetical protein